MKNAALFLTLALGFSAPAFAAENGTLVICKEISAHRQSGKRTMILRQMGNDELTEGQNYRFEFRMYENFSARPLVAVPVNVKTVDVMVNFSSDDKSLSGIIFRDELDQTAVHYNGEDIGFDCNKLT